MSHTGRSTTLTTKLKPISAVPGDISRDLDTLTNDDDLSQSLAFTLSDDDNQHASSKASSAYSLIKESINASDADNNTNRSREFDEISKTSKAVTNLHKATPPPYAATFSTIDSSASVVISIGGASSKRHGRGRGGAPIETFKPQNRKSNDLSELTIDKLNFSSLGIYGRDEEISILRKAFEESIVSSTIKSSHRTSAREKESKDSSDQIRQPRRHLICISGASGTGKSKLADTLEIPTKKTKGLFVCGKFNLNLRNEPYSAFSRAYAEICAEILRRGHEDPEVSLHIWNDIKESLNSELPLLAQVIPALYEIIDLEGTTDNVNISNQEQLLDDFPNPSTSSVTAEESKNRFQYAFLRFTRIISSHFKSLVIVLDDLQWADTSSLELLRILISDNENPHFLIVGTYRSDEGVDNPSHILHQTLNELESKSKQSRGDGSGSFQLTRIHLENLGVDSIYKIIQDVLSTSYNDERAFRLAEICHKKTDGNVFYLLSFLALLKEQNLLKFNLGSVSWTWDEMEIDSSTSAANNVVELLLSRINLLPPNLIELMKLASCLGSEFEVRIMELLWRRWTDAVHGEERNEESLSDRLKRLEREGFIGLCTNKVVPSYRWAHDKIQEAGLSLIPESDRGSYNRRIGEILLSELQDDEIDAIILVLADLLNDGVDISELQSLNDSLRLAHLNLRAGQKALSMSAFESAAVYAGNGIRLLPSNSWDEHYRLSLELYSLGAKAEGATGNVETMNGFCDVVLSQEGIPTSDKFAVYNTWIDSIAARGFFKEAIDILLGILQEFKCTFPKNNIMIGFSLVKHIFKIQSKTKSQDFSKLKPMQDKTRYELMKLLDKLALYFYMIGDDRMPLVIFRSMNWSVKYGSCDYSPSAFSTTGIILTGILNDLKGGSHFGEQALEMIKKYENSPGKAKTIFCVYAFLLVWTRPGGEVIKPLLKAYEMGLQTGDAENALWAIVHSILIRYIIGSSLESLDTDLLMYARQAKALRRDNVVYCCKVIHQVWLNLMGQDNIEDPAQMIGSSLSEEDYQYCKQNRFLQPVLRSWPNVLLSYFGKHLDLADSFEVEYMAKTQVASPVNMWYSLVGGVSCFAAARETGKKKFYKMGQSILLKVNKWVEGGNPNVRHIESFLEAELMVVNKKNFVARKSYEVSILLAARSGFQHDAAFASERYGRFCLDVEKDIDEASYRIGEAIKYWESWGALAKVRSLEAEFSDLIQEKPSQIYLN